MDELECELVVRMANGSYKCNICGKIYPHKSHINRHMTIHAGKVRHYCKLCPMEFFLQSDLHKHMLLHSGDTVYKCEICDKKFSQNGGLSRHMALHDGEKDIFECKVCFRQYTYRSSLMRHLLVHESKDKYGCGECREQFTDKATFLIHVQKKECTMSCQPMIIHDDVTTPCVTPSKSKPHTILSFETELPRCGVCSKTFSYRNALYKHCHARHPHFNCGCRHCEKRFDGRKSCLGDEDEVKYVMNYPEERSATKNRKSNEPTILPSETEIPKCKVCFKRFSYRTGLYRHYHVLHPEFNCGCRSCEKRFAEKESDNGFENVEICSETKIKDVKSEIEFVCGECDKKFKSKEAFAMHVQAQECSDSFEEKHIELIPSTSGYVSKDFEETTSYIDNEVNDGKRTIKHDVISTTNFKEGNFDGIIIKAEAPE